MAVYDVEVKIFSSLVDSIRITNNSNKRINYAVSQSGSTSHYILEPKGVSGSTYSNTISNINNLIIISGEPGAPAAPLFSYNRYKFVHGKDYHSYMYVDRDGKVVFDYSNGQSKFFTINGLSDTISPGGLSTLHIDDTRVEQINYNSKSYTTFPVDIPLVPNVKTMSVIGKTFNVQLDNELNIVRVKDGQTEYRQFPATIMVGENKTLQLYGKEDPEITIDYTGTQDPVISNTPATPPPVV